MEETEVHLGASGSVLGSWITSDSVPNVITPVCGLHVACSELCAAYVWPVRSDPLRP